LSTVLFGLATLQLRGVFGGPVNHLGIGLIVLGLIVPCWARLPRNLGSGQSL
jgi:hypothetical protein